MLKLVCGRTLAILTRVNDIPNLIPNEDDDDSVWHAYFDAERQRAKETFLLTRPELDALLRYLDAELRNDGCDGSLRRTILWAVEHHVDSEALCEQLGAFGGYCDDEVLLNVDPDDVFG